MTLTRRATLASLLSAGLGLAASPALAQDAAHWPDKPVHVIVPYPPGTPPDTLARYVADQLSQGLGQSFVVENKVGAGGSIGTDQVAHAPADGYTLLITPSGTVTIAPSIQKLNYSADDFTAVAQLGVIYAIATVRPDAPFANYKEFVAAAKAKPGKYSFASNGTGSATQLIGKILHQQAGIDVLEVPYKGATDSMTDLVGGRVDIMYAPITVPQIKAGRLKGLATISDRRNPQIPGVPTLVEQGFDIDKVPVNWFGLLAPKGTPQPIVDKLAAQTHKLLDTPQARQKLQAIAIEVDYQGPQAFSKTLANDAASMKAFLQKEGIRAK